MKDVHDFQESLWRDGDTRNCDVKHRRDQAGSMKEAQCRSNKAKLLTVIFHTGSGWNVITSITGNAVTVGAGRRRFNVGRAGRGHGVEGMHGGDSLGTGKLACCRSGRRHVSDGKRV